MTVQHQYAPQAILWRGGLEPTETTISAAAPGRPWCLTHERRFAQGKMLAGKRRFREPPRVPSG
jgi:hypothetical protein